MTHFDLTIPELAYLFGFLQADGHLSKSTRNRGRVRIELQLRDRTILERFKELLPVYSSIGERTRDTNFKKGSESAIWTLYDQDLRTTLNALGLPYGKKSKLVAPPEPPFSECDYFRGIIDGDGSLGLTGNGFPFLSLTTSSPAMSSAYMDFVFKVTGKRKSTKPNKRDKMYNVCVFKEDAQLLASVLYYPGCLCLRRKALSAERVQAWVRPSNMIRVTWEKRRWTGKEDATILSLPVQKAARKLRRTERSVRVRLSRLRQADRLAS
jgi:hypothetical protein